MISWVHPGDKRHLPCDVSVHVGGEGHFHLANLRPTLHCGAIGRDESFGVVGRAANMGGDQLHVNEVTHRAGVN